MNPSDLRGILTYISRFRDNTFVLSIDSDIVADENFQNLLLDVSVLRSLNIRVVLVYGAGAYIRQFAAAEGFTPSHPDGDGPVDEATLGVSLRASNYIGHEILERLNEVNQRAVITNAIVAHPVGIIDGVDWKMAGKVEKVDVEFLRSVVNSGIIPVVPPLGFDGGGRTFRVNSDGVAMEVAEGLQASKLMFITGNNGVEDAGKLSAQFSVMEVEEHIKERRGSIPPEVISKLEHGRRACRNGVKRVHIINGKDDDALLNEIFSNEGIGTMIYANEYEAIRRAFKKDVRVVQRLIRDSIASKELVPRGRQDIIEHLQDWYVFEIDKNIVGCVMLHLFAPDGKVAELGCLFVSEMHKNQGIGKKLLDFAQNQARRAGVETLLALSTQAFAYFEQKAGFQEGTIDILPEERKKRYIDSKRRSKILLKKLSPHL